MPAVHQLKTGPRLHLRLPLHLKNDIHTSLLKLYIFREMLMTEMYNE